MRHVMAGLEEVRRAPLLAWLLLALQPAAAALAARNARISSGSFMQQIPCHVAPISNPNALRCAARSPTSTRSSRPSRTCTRCCCDTRCDPPGGGAVMVWGCHWPCALLRGEFRSWPRPQPLCGGSMPRGWRHKVFARRYCPFPPRSACPRRRRRSCQTCGTAGRSCGSWPPTRLTTSPSCRRAGGLSGVAVPCAHMCCATLLVRGPFCFCQHLHKACATFAH